MREILFRGKRVDNGEWVWGGALYTIEGKETLIAPLGSMMVEVLAETVGQYTGLTDKNGKKIFEGDIVKNKDGLIGYICFLIQEMGYVVVYREHDTRLPYRLGHRNTGSQYECDLDIEIIGNIFDNPELMKE